jgi:hypothetical protein
MTPTDIAKSAIKAPRRERTLKERAAWKMREGYPNQPKKKTKEVTQQEPTSKRTRAKSVIKSIFGRIK